ncbi:MAG: DUF3306 domain-containing protein [Gammaproteobacteria bacterium]|jgi:hypothetical protein
MKNSEMQNGNDDEVNTTRQEEDFLSRWSRKKSESHQEAAAMPEPSDEPLEAGPDQAASEVPTKDLTDEDMPPLEELDQDADFSPFLSDGVSEALRQTALRKLFRSAKFNVCDGLDDYAEDYTKFAPLGDVITADMKYHMQRALDKLEALADDAEEGAAQDSSSRTLAAEAELDEPKAAKEEGTMDEAPEGRVAGSEEDNEPGRA